MQSKPDLRSVAVSSDGCIFSNTLAVMNGALSRGVQATRRLQQPMEGLFVKVFGLVALSCCPPRLLYKFGRHRQ